MLTSSAGFREHAHTADWELEVWAPDLPTLFEQAARGMYALSGVRLRDAPRQERVLELSAFDYESLLVAFLEELLYIESMEGLAFETFEVEIEDKRLRARLQGAPLAALDKEIKAVTYHKLNIRNSQRGYEVTIVFDV